MTMYRPRALFLTLTLSLASQATETLPFPDKAPPAKPLTAEGLQIEVTSLNSYIGTYPTAKLLKPQVNTEVERGMIFAYLHQGKQAKTLKQIDYCLTVVPYAEWAKSLREGIKDGRLGVHRK